MEIAWHAKLPTPSFDARRVEPEYLVDLMRNPQLKAGVDYIVVDVRRQDFEHVAISNAINLPAHSFYPTLPTATTILSRIPIVVFHCGACGAISRGARVAGWYKDELERRGIPPQVSEALILEGGIKDFEEKFGDVEDLLIRLDSA
ncbi:uncharacterized protein EI90DRAFT_3071408 [Cantharellus anzutake]|uniref:uncharacterized protein n=1 Tax=Cantharellus anzutake TaxID=1750568 RepID=UPI00190406F9|nr:uncharacterized protein EI90DRAFT_3071408 [Cantharellus anzutake]KAF8326073.1 hypothetical protein EI90DRAFT_3071408 [Cantharellus anzutake]